MGFDGRLDRIELEIVLPPEFPEKYRGALVLAAEGCKVRRTLTRPPEIAISTRQATEGAGSLSLSA